MYRVNTTHNIGVDVLDKTEGRREQSSNRTLLKRHGSLRRASCVSVKNLE